MTRLGMIFAKEVDVLSADFSPEQPRCCGQKLMCPFPMLEFFGGRTRSNTICIYIYMCIYMYVIPMPRFTSTKCFPDIYRKTCVL